MAQNPPQEKPLIDRIIAWVPGYGGYIGRADRRASDRVLREAVADRLRVAKQGVDKAIEAALNRVAWGEIGPLEKSRKHIDILAERIRAAGSGNDAFWSGHVGDAKAEPLHAFDLDLFQRADALARRFENAEPLAGLDADLAALESTVDERARLLQGLH